MVKRSDVAKIELECVECIESYLCLYRMCVSITNDRNHLWLLKLLMRVLFPSVSGSIQSGKPLRKQQAVAMLLRNGESTLAVV